MATTTISKAFTKQPLHGDDPTKWRVEHSVSNMATCQQAACKREGTRIAKGELRIGTHTWFEADEKYVWLWRHWGCVTPHQIRGLQTLSGGKPDAVPGFSSISSESQEQVRLALENGKVADKEFQDVRPDLAKPGGSVGNHEIRDAVGYKVDVAKRSAGCRNSTCREDDMKIVKGELRLGITRDWDGDHITWVYKHWACISLFDFNAANKRLEEESLEGVDDLPESYKAFVLASFQAREIVEPPKLQTEVSKKAKKPRPARKKKAETEDDSAATGAEIHNPGVEESNAQGKVPKKRTTREVEPADDNEEEPAFKKRRGRSEKKSL